MSTHAEHLSAAAAGSPRSRAARWYGLAALLVAALLLCSLLVPQPWAWLLPERVHVQIDEQVYELTERRWQQAFARSLETLSAREQLALIDLEKELEEQVALAFQLPRGKVPELADWYYSLSGQATRAGLGVMDWFSSDGLPAVRVAAAINQRLFPEQQWVEANRQLLARLGYSVNQHSQAALDEMRLHLHEELAPYRKPGHNSTETLALNLNISADSLRQSLAGDVALAQGTLAVSASVLATLAARRAGQAALTRAGSRGMMGPMTAGCVTTGPLAWLCAAGVFTGTLVATEYAVLKIDEAINRDALEASFQHDIDRVEREFLQALRLVYVTGVENEFVARRELIEAQVRPIDQVLAGKR